jgi:hypothetical protein
MTINPNKGNSSNAQLTDLGNLEIRDIGNKENENLLNIVKDLNEVEDLRTDRIGLKRNEAEGMQI